MHFQAVLEGDGLKIIKISSAHHTLDEIFGSLDLVAVFRFNETKDRQVTPDPIDDRKFHEWRES